MIRTAGPFSLLSSRNSPLYQEKLSNQSTAENSGMEPDSIDAAVEKNYELASEADLIVNEPDEAAMEPDLSNISDQNDPEEAQTLVNEETDSGKAERQTSREDSKAMSDPTKADASTIAIGCWKGRSNLSVMVTAIDCQV
ncbi:hypothetical protein NC651_012868 [Populus alba x Populus x berolinensis]|nr:hypothetical protein NC651_012868 [Populus alba x Populus x berolinensis]